MNARDFLLLLLVCIIWAAHHVLGKVVVSGLEIPPLFYAAMRFGLVALVVSPWLFPIPERPWRVAIAAFLISGASFGLLFVGLQTTTPSASVIVQQLGVPMMILLSMTMLGERISLRRGFGIALTIAGGLIVIWDPAGFVFSEGLVLVAIGTFSGSLGAVMMKGIEGLTPLQVQAWAGASSMVALSALSAWLERDHLFHVQRVGWTLAAAVLFSAIVVSVLSQTLYYYLLRRHPISVVSPLMIIATLLTVVLGIVVTGDPFDLRMAIGAAFAICGVLVITTRPAASSAAEPHRRVERA